MIVFDVLQYTRDKNILELYIKRKHSIKASKVFLKNSEIQNTRKNIS